MKYGRKISSAEEQNYFYTLLLQLVNAILQSGEDITLGKDGGASVPQAGDQHIVVRAGLKGFDLFPGQPIQTAGLEKLHLVPQQGENVLGHVGSGRLADGDSAHFDHSRRPSFLQNAALDGPGPHSCYCLPKPWK